MFLARRKNRGGGHEPPPLSSYVPLPRIGASLASCLRYRHSWERKDTTDGRCAGRKWRSHDKEIITLSLSRTTAHALTSKGIDIGVGTHAGVSWVKTVRQILHDEHELVLFLIR